MDIRTRTTTTTACLRRWVRGLVMVLGVAAVMRMPLGGESFSMIGIAGTTSNTLIMRPSSILLVGTTTAAYHLHHQHQKHQHSRRGKEGCWHAATTSSSSSSETDGSSSSASSSSSSNNNKPILPEVPGDYDWDAKYSADPDWLIGAAVPGKGKLSDIELARQATALGGLEDKWRREREIMEYEQSAKTGFVPKAELLNGRSAMFFLITGLLTEYWTGISIPGQVEELFRIAGVIGLD